MKLQDLKSTTAWGLIATSSGARATQQAQPENAPALSNWQELNLQHHFTIKDAQCAFNTTAQNPADVFSLYRPCGEITNIFTGSRPQTLPMYSLANSSTVTKGSSGQQKSKICLYTDGKASEEVNTCLTSKTEEDNAILAKRKTLLESVLDRNFLVQVGSILGLLALFLYYSNRNEEPNRRRQHLHLR